MNGKTKQWLSLGKVVIEKRVIGGPPRVGRPQTLEASEFRVERIVSREVLDSRGNPTVQVDLYTKNGFGDSQDPQVRQRAISKPLNCERATKQRYNGGSVNSSLDELASGHRLRGLP